MSDRKSAGRSPRFSISFFSFLCLIRLGHIIMCFFKRFLALSRISLRRSYNRHRRLILRRNFVGFISVTWIASSFISLSSASHSFFSHNSPSEEKCQSVPRRRSSDPFRKHEKAAAKNENRTKDVEECGARAAGLRERLAGFVADRYPKRVSCDGGILICKLW